MTKKQDAQTTLVAATLAAALSITPTSVDGKRIFKVLSPEGASQNGGTMVWSLPDGDKPGEWHETPRATMCYEGLHLTAEPARWWGERCRVFEVEAEGVAEKGGAVQWAGDKVVARRVRLVRELDEGELVGVGIIRSGVHTIEGDRFVVVEGSAQVTASGSAQVTAYGSAQVTAYDSAQVTASGSAQVTAYDSAQVTASGSAQVTAYSRAQVTASGSAQVTASGSAQVTAYDSAQVTAYDSAQVTASGESLVSTRKTYWNEAKVTLTEAACHVDFRSGEAVFTTAKVGS